MYDLPLMEKWFIDFFIFRCSSLTNPVKNMVIGSWLKQPSTIDDKHVAVAWEKELIKFFKKYLI